jgi:hypothetical protein
MGRKKLLIYQCYVSLTDAVAKCVCVCVFLASGYVVGYCNA